jgi:hypothetical protein
MSSAIEFSQSWQSTSSAAATRLAKVSTVVAINMQARMKLMSNAQHQRRLKAVRSMRLLAGTSM